jgi:hypothetical protein
MKIIVARYNENVEWTKKFPNVIIYNKGQKLDQHSLEQSNEYNEIILENVGREGHTFYKYIYDNYDNLDDYTIFLQGIPFSHHPNMLNLLTYYTTNSENITLDFEFLGECIIECNLSGCKCDPLLPLQPIYEFLFGEKKTDLKFLFVSGGQFIVSKKQILKRPKEFYLKIVNILQHAVNPNGGYVIERFHKLIFS